MKLSDRISEDIKQAMRDKQKDKLEALRSVKTAFTLARTEKSVGSDLSEEEEVKIIQKLVKQRKDSAIVYREQNRAELAEKEETEAEYIGEYLPEQMTREELAEYLKKLIADTGASGMKDMGKVMGRATSELSGRAEGKMISEIVRGLLS